eukprot:7134233-Prymnesium_polylepis.1
MCGRPFLPDKLDLHKEACAEAHAALLEPLSPEKMAAATPKARRASILAAHRHHPSNAEATPEMRKGLS